MYKDLNPVVGKIEKIVRECGDIILNADRNEENVEVKSGHGNFVTKYDTMIQAKLKEKLTALVPGSFFYGEEGDDKDDVTKGYAFVVDPIDGTMNFMRDMHISCISVALLKEGKRYIGVVFNPYLDEMFTAETGKGAYLNGKPIHVSALPLSNGLVLFGTCPYYTELHRKTFDMALGYMAVANDVRRCGSAALDLCTIAAGRAELYFELVLSPWDYAAGSLIVEEAGGKVTTVEGGEITLTDKCSILATNGKD